MEIAKMNGDDEVMTVFVSICRRTKAKIYN
jgi:hypothetical protein